MAERRDLFLDALEDVAHVVRVFEPVADRGEDLVFGDLAANKKLVVACSLGGAEASVVAAGLATHLSDGRAANTTRHRSGQEMGRSMLLPAALILRESSLALATGPATLGDLAALPHRLPQFGRDDAERFVFGDTPLRLRLLEPLLAAGTRIATCLGSVPEPSADVFLVVEDAADRGGGPALGRLLSTGDAFIIQGLDDAGERLAVSIRGEDAKHDGSLARIDLHPVSIGSRLPLLVDPHLADGDRPVTEGALADRVAALLLTELAPECLLLEVAEMELVEYAADLDAESCFFVVGVEAIGDRNYTDTFEMELGKYREHEVVVSGETTGIT